MMLIVAIEEGDQWNQFSFRYGYENYGGFSQMAIMSLLLTGESVLLCPRRKYLILIYIRYQIITILSLFSIVANVIFVAIGATLMFRLKEVLPVKKKVFWDDLKIARRIYQGRALDSVTGEVLTTEMVHEILNNLSADSAE
jgi:hypothetical protein